MNIGDVVTAKVRCEVVELVVSSVIQVSDAMKQAKPGIVCTIIAEGSHKRTQLCKIADVFSDGCVAWM
jgi:hypothetical protein